VLCGIIIAETFLSDTNSKLKVSKEFASKSMIYDFYANSCLKFIVSTTWSKTFAFKANNLSIIYDELFAAKVLDRLDLR
jgi:hypothetical protein